MKHIVWCAVLLSGFASVATASVIFDNLGPNFVINPVTNYYGANSGSYGGVPFVAGSTGNLGSIVAPLAGGVSAASIFHFGLYADASGQPGTLLEDWNTTLPASEALVTLTSFLHPILSSGSSYWFVLAALQDSAVWYMNGTSELGGLWDGVALVPLNQDFPANLTPGLQVNSSVPEPAAWILATGGLIAAILLRRRQTRIAIVS